MSPRRTEPATVEAYAARLGKILGGGWQWIGSGLWLGFEDGMPLYIDLTPRRWEVRDMFETLHAYGQTPMRALKAVAKERRQRGRQTEARKQRARGCSGFGQAILHLDRAGAIRRAMQRRLGFKDDSDVGRWASMLVARRGGDRSGLVRVWREEMRGARLR